MEVLAMDLGDTAGYAHTCGVSGNWIYKKRRGDSPGLRFLKLRNWLERFLDNHKTSLIAYEQAHHRGGAATHVLHGYIATVEQVAAERNLELSARHSASIKKFATNNGRASKEEMIVAALQFGGYPQDDNEADAICLLRLVETEE